MGRFGGSEILRDCLQNFLTGELTIPTVIMSQEMYPNGGVAVAMSIW